MRQGREGRRLQEGLVKWNLWRKEEQQRRSPSLLMPLDKRMTTSIKPARNDGGGKFCAGWSHYYYFPCVLNFFVNGVCFPFLLKRWQLRALVNVVIAYHVLFHWLVFIRLLSYFKMWLWWSLNYSDSHIVAFPWLWRFCDWTVLYTALTRAAWWNGFDLFSGRF
jgi:hypothetical protein